MMQRNDVCRTVGHSRAVPVLSSSSDIQRAAKQKEHADLDANFVSCLWVRTRRFSFIGSSHHDQGNKVAEHDGVDYSLVPHARLSGLEDAQISQEIENANCL